MISSAEKDSKSPPRYPSSRIKRQKEREGKKCKEPPPADQTSQQGEPGFCVVNYVPFLVAISQSAIVIRSLLLSLDILVVALFQPSFALMTSHPTERPRTPRTKYLRQGWHDLPRHGLFWRIIVCWRPRRLGGDTGFQTSPEVLTGPAGIQEPGVYGVAGGMRLGRNELF